MTPVVRSLIVSGAFLTAVPLLAQEPVADSARATGLESAGRLEDAVRVYRRSLEKAPADLAVLERLERTLDRLGRLAEMRPFLNRAVEVAPQDEGLRDLEFRALASAFGRDSAAASYSRWIAAFPNSAQPYRQWAFWLARNGDLGPARAVLDTGQMRLGDANLAQFSAQVLIASGDWDAAARQWVTVVIADPTLAASAGAAIGQAPAQYHEAILGTLFREDTPVTQWLAADLLARWGRAVEGWTRLEPALPADPRQATLLVRRFGERARLSGGADGRRARGAALEWLADRAVPRQAEALRLEAAQLYADAGDLAAAHRLLDRMGAISPDRPGQAARSMTTLIVVLADAGQLDEAEARFREWESRLSGDDAERVRHTLARSRLASGALDRAAELIGTDSSIGALVVRGWIALYRGRLTQVKTLFREAGPFAGTPADGTRRATLLVLLERIGAEQLPALGAGLFAAYRGDTAVALDSLEAAAGQLPPAAGRADLLALAGEMALSAGLVNRAESVLQRALSADSTGPAAPGVEYRLAEAHLAQGGVAAAVDRLEHLIVTFPESAIVPEARRLLDRARHRIPTP